MKVKSLSHVQLLVTPWTGAYQAPPFMGFSRQGYWSGLSFPSPGDLPDPGIEPRSPTLQADALPCETPVYSSYVSLCKFIPRYLILFVAVVNGIDSFISFSDFSLLVYRNAGDYCVLIFVSCNFAKFTD